MADSILKRANAARKRWTRSLGKEISTPSGRRQAWVHFNLVDHAFLRHLWTNRYRVAEGVWRSNQPGPARVRAEAARGIKTIISLRGGKLGSFSLLEQEAADEVGIKLEFVTMSAGVLLEAEHYVRLLDLFQSVEKPFLFHCKSGADRAGLAATMYLLAEEGQPFDVATEQLHWKYLHSRTSKKTGILYYMLTRYRDENAVTPLSLRAWFLNRYDPVEITASYRKSRGMKPLE